MKTKSVLKFYFDYESAEGMLDRLILKRAADISGAYTAERCAERVIEVIERKYQLSKFWLHLDSVMDGFCESERAVLRNYALSQGSTDKRLAHRLAVRFTRRAQAGLNSVREGFNIMKEFLAY